MARLDAFAANGKPPRTAGGSTGDANELGSFADNHAVDDLIEEFLLESGEGLDRMERSLTALEAEPANRDLLAEIFRAVHTIKGTTGFLALPRLEKLAHAGENLLGLLRDGSLHATRDVVNALLALLDRLRSILNLIAATGQDGMRDGDHDTELIARLDGLRGSGGVEGSRTGPGTSAAVAGEPRVAQPADHTLRVDLDVMNRMMNLVGELVLTRNQILQANHRGAELAAPLTRRLDSVTADLREIVMQARTQPVEHLFGRLPRMVRDLAQSCGRSVRLELSGQETRLDKTLLELLKDPLTHALRNAVDHGIEPQAERMRRGKPPEGLIRLSARHEGGQVVVEISDDGGGIDIRQVRARAAERLPIPDERLQAMSDAEALQLVFEPGLSTRTDVSLISGRGVGMDVVRSNIQSAGGVVELLSQLGEGTTVRIRVPLTLAIVPALVMLCGRQSIAIPQNAVAELLIVRREHEEELVQQIGGAPMLRLREQLVPLLHVSDLLGLGKNIELGYYVAVIEVKGRRFGLVVDDLMDPQEIVVKPLAPVLRAAGVFSGASVLGNGELALILDLPRLLALAQVDLSEEPVADLPPTFETEAMTSPQSALFTFETLGGERAAIDLAAVDRVQQVAAEEIEYCEGRAMLQYGKDFVMLEAPGAGRMEPAADGTHTVVLCHRHGELVGLVVRRVLDIAESHLLRKTTPAGSRLALVGNRLAKVETGYTASGRNLREAA